MDVIEDAETLERAMRLRRMTDEFLNAMTPQERDRMMQTHMAQARGPIGNAVLLRQMTDAMLRAREAQAGVEVTHDG